MQELNMAEVGEVSGGIIWIPIVIIVIGLSGCDDSPSDSPAVNKEGKNFDKKDKAIEEQTK